MAVVPPSSERPALGCSDYLGCERKNPRRTGGRAVLIVWAMPDSNRRPLPCEGSALPTAPIAQDPEGRFTMIPDRGSRNGTRTRPTRCESRGDTRGTVLVCRGVNDQLKSLRRLARWGPRGCSAVGSAQPCQGWGREFESRHPLECSVLSRRNPGERTARGVKPHGGVAERLGTGLQSRLHGFESRRHLQALHSQLNCLAQARLAQR